jgi:predicted amidohydrolase YtcJ
MLRLIFVCGIFFGGLNFTASAVGAPGPADLVVRRADILTVDRDFHHAASLAVKEGRFVAVGSDSEIAAWIGPATREIDAKGSVVIPGLLESHVHATGAAKGELQQPFRQLSSISEIQAWVRAAAAKTPAHGWIQLPRVDITRIREHRMPTRAELDAAAPDHPTIYTWQYANRIVQVLNRQALRITGITAATEAPPGGKITRGPDGLPEKMENCSALVLKFIPGHAVSDAPYLDELESLLRRYNAIGITSITERNTNLEGYHTYETLKTAGRLAVRVTVTIGLISDGSVAGTEKAIRALPFKTGDGDDWVRVGPLKIGVDGGALYGTMFMREPYPEKALAFYGLDEPGYLGTPRITPENIENMIRTGHRLGWQMASHVTGNAGVDAVLDAVEAANADSPIAPRRYNLIHAYFPDEATARRAARLGVCVDAQPALYYKDADALAEVWGRDKIAHFMGVGTWHAGGVMVSINSDHMQGVEPDTSLNPYNPFLTMQTAVSRKTEGGQVIGPDEALSREEALRMMTVEAAWQSFDETRKGSIEVGKLADFAILTGDFMKCPIEQMKNLRSRLTVVDGKVVYTRDQNTDTASAGPITR